MVPTGVPAVQAGRWDVLVTMAITPVSLCAPDRMVHTVRRTGRARRGSVPEVEEGRPVQGHGDEADSASAGTSVRFRVSRQLQRPVASTDDTAGDRHLQRRGWPARQEPRTLRHGRPTINDGQRGCARRHGRQRRLFEQDSDVATLQVVGMRAGPRREHDSSAARLGRPSQRRWADPRHRTQLLDAPEVDGVDATAHGHGRRQSRPVRVGRARQLPVRRRAEGSEGRAPRQAGRRSPGSLVRGQRRRGLHLHRRNAPAGSSSRCASKPGRHSTPRRPGGRQRHARRRRSRSGADSGSRGRVPATRRRASAPAFGRTRVDPPRGAMTGSYGK